MKYFLLPLLLAVSSTTAWTSSSSSNNNRKGTSFFQNKAVALPLEKDTSPRNWFPRDSAFLPLDSWLGPQKRTTTTTTTAQTNKRPISNAAAKYGLPWTETIDPSSSVSSSTSSSTTTTTSGTSTTLFMPFWEWQVDYMQTHLTNLRVLPEQWWSYQDRTTNNQKHRIHTLTCTSEEYKYIRLTALDAGSRTQVFTSVWYPDPAYPELPILGCDLLQFGQKRHVCICDFQPLNGTNTDSELSSWHGELDVIRNQYPSLQQPMSTRFYNPDDGFFSKQLLLAKHMDDASKDEHRSSSGGAQKLIHDDFFTAWQHYVQTHVKMVQSTPRQPQQATDTLQKHAAYDQYSASRDPAHGMLASYFGQEFADEYVYQVLFPLSGGEEEIIR